MKRIFLASLMFLIYSTAFAHGVYWYDSDGNLVNDSSGNCIKTVNWTSDSPEKCHEEPEPIAVVPEVVEVEVPEVVEEVVEIEVPEVIIEPEPVVVEEPAPEPVKPIILYRNKTIETVVHFDVNEYELDDANRSILDRLTMTAKSAVDILQINIAGYTDTRGSAKYNLALSEKRIQSVLDYFRSKDLTSAATYAYGESSPVLNAQEQENYDDSRRVEVSILVKVVR